MTPNPNAKNLLGYWISISINTQSSSGGRAILKKQQTTYSHNNINYDHTNSNSTFARHRRPICHSCSCHQHHTNTKNAEQSEAAWHQFGSNVNYRIVAMLDVNGGADASPNFDGFYKRAAEEEVEWKWWGKHHHKENGSKNKNDASTAKTKTTKSSGYSIPVEVLTLQDSSGKYRQRISYYSGMQVDYNMNGEGYKVISTPFEKKSSDDNNGNEETERERVCMFTGGNSTSEEEKVGYLNFFPTLDQMEHYTLGKMVTSEVSTHSSCFSIRGLL